MISRLHNNVAICAIAIAFTAQKTNGVISLPNSLLILPFISHRLLLNHLARKNVEISNIEKLLVDKLPWFANFDARFYDGLCNSVNGIQFLVDLELAKLSKEGIRITQKIEYDKKMGKRAEKIEKASSNLAAILSWPSDHLFTSLRIRL